ncbi:MAG: FAD:protein FMN transferase [Agarilytica sp.]
MPEKYSYFFKMMGSLCHVQVYAEDQTSANKYFSYAKSELDRIERKYSRDNKFSVVSQINASSGTGRSVKLDSETRYLVDYAERIYKQSNGMFDITTAVLRDLWNGKNGVEPSQGTLEETLINLTGWNIVGWGGGEILLPETGMKIDFDTFIKEYAADKLVKILGLQGAPSVCVDLGGSVAVSGPNLDGGPWNIEVASPCDTLKIITELPIVSGGLAGNHGVGPSSESGFDSFGQLYCPKTGLPVHCESVVKVQAERCLVAGVITAIAMLQGEEAGIDWLSKLGIPFIVYRPDDDRIEHKKIA